MTRLTPRKFEELVAELFRGKGYDIELTPPTADGGFDIRAVHRQAVGTAMVLIECKRYSQKKAGLGVVRGLYGVVESERATRGIIATTSVFTRGRSARISITW